MCPSVAYETLVSHSPPLFSHSPPSSFFAPPPQLASPHSPRRFGPAFHTLPRPSPRRPCLVAGEAAQRLKKRVVFADDRGMALTQVKLMTEPSNVPPLWTSRFLAEVTHGLSADPEAAVEEWEVGFAQPASDYVEFRKRLEANKVSLENVIVKDQEELIVGTIKVTNISFEKEVSVRLTADQWKTHTDHPTTFVATPSTSGYALYDTFSFSVPIPPRSRRLEFCVKYKCEEGEFWDNNDGANYVISKKAEKGGAKKVEEVGKCTDAVRAKVESWSEFASWTHLENSSPYW